MLDEIEGMGFIPAAVAAGPIAGATGGILKSAMNLFGKSQEQKTLEAQIEAEKDRARRERILLAQQHALAFEQAELDVSRERRNQQVIALTLVGVGALAVSGFFVWRATSKRRNRR